MKRRLTRALARYLVNPFMRLLAGWIPGWALLETTGRRSGLLRRVPVGDGLRGDTLWVVAEHGRGAGWVRNVEADPDVRVRIRGRWRRGRAQPLPDDDPRARQRTIGGFNAAFVRLIGTELLTVRIDLEPNTRPRTAGDWVREGAIAGLTAGALGGIPSTVHALATGRDVLDTVRAAGNVVLPADASGWLLAVGGLLSHLAISAGWGAVLSVALPRRGVIAWGLLAGLAIAALDLGLIGQLRPLVRALPQIPQILDHAAYGLIAGALIARYRRDADPSEG